MQETITLTKLRVFAYHGVLAEEKKLGQPFYITISFCIDKAFRRLNDSLSDTVSYADIAQSATTFFSEHTFDLIEEAAYQLARFLMLTYKALTSIFVQIEKPQAPIPLPFENVSVSLSLKWHTVFIGLGSNLGDKEAYLIKAKHTLQENLMLKNIKMSSLYKTKAWGNENQPDFCNAVMQLETLLSPEDLLHTLQTVENENDRVRLEKWGPRTLDLDILYYDDLILYTENLKIPHPYATERRFVLEPMCELNPYFIDPLTKKNIMTHLKSLERTEIND